MVNFVRSSHVLAKVAKIFSAVCLPYDQHEDLVTLNHPTETMYSNFESHRFVSHRASCPVRTRLDFQRHKSTISCWVMWTTTSEDVKKSLYSREFLRLVPSIVIKMSLKFLAQITSTGEDMKRKMKIDDTSQR